MSFNYGLEKKKFETAWAKLRRDYLAAGMSEDAIQKMYEYDWNNFKSRRSYENHEQLISGFQDETESLNEEESPLFLRNLDAFSVTDHYALEDRFAWLECITYPPLKEKLDTLDDIDKELLSLIFVDEFTHKEAAQKMGISIQGFLKRYKKIKKNLELV